MCWSRTRVICSWKITVPSEQEAAWFYRQRQRAMSTQVFITTQLYLTASKTPITLAVNICEKTTNTPQLSHVFITPDILFSSFWCIIHCDRNNVRPTEINQKYPPSIHTDGDILFIVSHTAHRFPPKNCWYSLSAPSCNWLLRSTPFWTFVTIQYLQNQSYCACSFGSLPGFMLLTPCSNPFSLVVVLGRFENFYP